MFDLKKEKLPITENCFNTIEQRFLNCGQRQWRSRKNPKGYMAV